MVLAHAEEAAETQHRVGDPAAALFEDDALDGADMPAIGTIDAGAFDPVAGDQRRRVLDVGVAAAGVSVLVQHGAPPVSLFSWYCPRLKTCRRLDGS